jgi:hypothetical protein
MSDHHRQARLVAATGVGASLVLYLFFYLPRGDFDYNFGYGYGRDFINFWGAGRLTGRGDGMMLFDFDAYNAWLRAYFAVDIGPFHNYSYPPHLVPLLLPFGALPYGAALALFTVVSVAAVALVVRACGGDTRTAALAAASPAVVATAFQGQLSTLVAVLLFGALATLRSRPVVAGVLLGLMTVKPHLGVVAGLLVLIERRWSTVVAALATALALAALATLLLGVDAWGAFRTVTLAKQTQFMEDMVSGFRYFQIAPYSGLRTLGMPQAIAWLIHGALGLAATVLAIRIWLTNPDRPAAMAAVAAASVVVAPYANSYDLCLVALPLALMIGERGLSPGPAGIAAMALWLAPALTIPLAVLWLPLMPLIVSVSALALCLTVGLSATRPALGPAAA